MKVIVIGGGPGGYEAGILAAKLGAEVTVVEKDELGGTCLNRGCIPTKAFLATSDTLEAIQSAKEFGINLSGDITIDYPAVVARKNSIRDTLIKGIHGLFKLHNVNLVKGFGKIVNKNTVEVKKEDGTIETLEADKIILATGSVPVAPAMFKYDGKKVITSDEVLDLETVPESMIIVGGGVIGCEIGQFLSRVGSKITIVEALSQILPNEDEDVSKQLARQFRRDKIKVIAGVGVSEVTVSENGVKADLANGKSVEADIMLVAIGRKGFIDNLGAQDAGIELDERGRIVVNDKMETSLEGVYAIGDIVATPLLAHVASKEGFVAVENALGGDKHISYKAVPGCVYTDPEVASVGLTEAECEKKGIAYKKGEFEFRGLGKAKAINKLNGFTKVLVDEQDVIIGAAVVGPHATDLLAELTLAVHLGLTAEQVGDAIHPHPSLSEGLMEALHDVHGRSVHK